MQEKKRKKSKGQENDGDAMEVQKKEDSDDFMYGDGYDGEYLIILLQIGSHTPGMSRMVKRAKRMKTWNGTRKNWEKNQMRVHLCFSVPTSSAETKEALLNATAPSRAEKPKGYQSKKRKRSDVKTVPRAVSFVSIDSQEEKKESRKQQDKREKKRAAKRRKKY